MMSRSIDLTYSDNGPSYPGRPPWIRPRDIILRLEKVWSRNEERVQVIASGDALENGGGDRWGVTRNSFGTINLAVNELRKKWDERVVSRRLEDDDSGSPLPFAEHWDMREVLTFDDWEQTMQELARAGEKVFRLLFEQGDDGLPGLGDHLKAALSGRPLVVRIQSDDLCVPWPMLYTPSGSTTMLSDDRSGPSFEGFWGYRHLVEHAFNGIGGDYESRIFSNGGRLCTGLNVNPALDKEYPPEEVFVRPIVDFFADPEICNDVDIDLRDTRDLVAGAFEGGTCADHVAYFGCHTKAIRLEPDAAQTHCFEFVGGDITVTDLITWLGSNPFTANPVVFLNTCRGGAAAGHLYPSFSKTMMKHGANCLIGPQVDITPLFGREYALRFFTDFFMHGDNIGDIVRGLTRQLLERWNPLGLTISLYRGIDTHISPPVPLPEYS